ncbi:MAG: hypothetical protein V3T05_14150 [Myxococcota bacterium]
MRLHDDAHEPHGAVATGALEWISVENTTDEASQSDALSARAQWAVGCRRVACRGERELRIVVSRGRRWDDDGAKFGAGCEQSVVPDLRCLRGGGTKGM